MGGLLAAAPFAMPQTQSQTGVGQQGQTQTEQQTSPQYGQSQQSQMQNETPRERQSRAAAQMLEHTADARQAIQDKDQQKAMSHVNQALEAAGKIQTTAGMIPIYTELERVSIIGPLRAARGGQTGESSTTASREATEPQSSSTAVRDVEGGFTSVAVDMSQARTHLDAAKTALQSNDMAQADRALQAVQSSVSMTTVEGDMPLVKARQNLSLAMTQAQQGQVSNAQAPLKEAMNALNTYGQTSSAAHASEAAQMSRDIQNFASTMQDKTQAQVSDQIQQWWNRLADWTSGSSQGRSGTPPQQ